MKITNLERFRETLKKHAPPCEVHRCHGRAYCAITKSACESYEVFVNRGWMRKPGIPTKEIFERVFKEDDD